MSKPMSELTLIPHPSWLNPNKMTMSLCSERAVPMKEKLAVCQKVAKAFSKAQNIFFPPDFLRRKRRVPKNDFYVPETHIMHFIRRCWFLKCSEEIHYVPIGDGNMWYYVSIATRRPPHPSNTQQHTRTPNNRQQHTTTRHNSTRVHKCPAV